MLLLLGDTRSKKIITLLRQHGWGRMFVTCRPSPYAEEPWGFDNGAYVWWVAGHDFNGDTFLRRLDRAYMVGTPYLAVAPDIPTQGERSLAFSINWLDRLPREWPWYLAVQDGMGLADVEAVIDRFAGIFLGGSNKFKGTAWHWAQLAHRHEKRFHYGRAGTIRATTHALEAGADSCDSAFPLWEQRRLEALTRLVLGRWRQMAFFGPEVSAVLPTRNY